MPFFHIDLISLNWLHVVDLGISLDFIGCFFKYLIRRWQILQVLWCNRMPFVISSKTGFIYCGKGVMNRMMLGGSWTAICFSCHCGGQMPRRQCSCPCHDLMRYHHSFEPIWWYNFFEEWEKMSAFVVCSTHLFAEVNQGCQRFNQGCQCCVAHPMQKVLAQSMERKPNLAPWRKLVIANRRNK